MAPYPVILSASISSGQQENWKVVFFLGSALWNISAFFFSVVQQRHVLSYIPDSPEPDPDWTARGSGPSALVILEKEMFEAMKWMFTTVKKKFYSYQ